MISPLDVCTRSPYTWDYFNWYKQQIFQTDFSTVYQHHGSCCILDETNATLLQNGKAGNSTSNSTFRSSTKGCCSKVRALVHSQLITCHGWTIPQMVNGDQRQWPINIQSQHSVIGDFLEAGQSSPKSPGRPFPFPDRHRVCRWLITSNHTWHNIPYDSIW